MPWFLKKTLKPASLKPMGNPDRSPPGVSKGTEGGALGVIIIAITKML